VEFSGWSDLKYYRRSSGLNCANGVDRNQRKTSTEGRTEPTGRINLHSVHPVVYHNKQERNRFSVTIKTMISRFIYVLTYSTTGFGP
jgi:hypothetical protein